MRILYGQSRPGAAENATTVGERLLSSSVKLFHSRSAATARRNWQSRANRLGTPVTACVAHEAPGVLQARHAQMDERAPEAPQKRAAKSRKRGRTGPAAAGILRYRAFPPRAGRRGSAGDS